MQHLLRVDDDYIVIEFNSDSLRFSGWDDSLIYINFTLPYTEPIDKYASIDEYIDYIAIDNSIKLIYSAPIITLELLQDEIPELLL